MLEKNGQIYTRDKLIIGRNRFKFREAWAESIFRGKRFMAVIYFP